MDQHSKETRNGMCVELPICDRQAVTEVAFDFSLPDYQPEIKRLLRVRATVLPADKYIGTPNAELSGRIEYAIHYTGNDGALYCSLQEGEYQITCPFEMPGEMDLNQGVLCDADTVCETVIARVAAPRRISVKCRLRSRVQLLGSTTVETPTPVYDGTVERLCGSVMSLRRFVGVGDPMQLGDEILCDGQEGELRVISAEGDVFVSEAIAGSGVVNCRGEVCLKLICCREGEAALPTVQTRRIPFSQAVTVDGVEVNCDACADGVCSGVHVTVEEGRILCEMSVILRARAQRNEEISYTRDLYSTCCECKTEYRDRRFLQGLRSLNGNFSLNHTAALSEVGLRPDVRVVDACVTPSVTALESEHGKYKLTGRCRCQLILFDGEEMSLQEIEAPFRYECEGGEPVGDYDASVSAISCRARIDGERVSVDAELAVMLTTRKEESLRTVFSASLGEEVKGSGAAYTVCYPAREDTLWSVAKRYHRSIGAMMQVNHLAEAPSADSAESLAGVRYLLI